MHSVFVFTGWVPLSPIAQHTPLELFWFFYNTFWIILRNLIFFSYKGSTRFYMFANTNQVFIYALFGCIFFIFTFLLFFFKKPRTKKRILLIYYILLLSTFVWYYLYQGFCCQIAGLPTISSGFLPFSERFKIYKLLTPLALLGVWVIVLYKPSLRKPLTGAPIMFNSWFFFLTPLLFFTWAFTYSLFLIFIISEFIIFYLFFVTTLRIKKRNIHFFTFIKCTLVVCTLVKDFFIINSSFCVFLFDWVLNVFLILWVVLWFWKIDTYVNKQHPIVSFFFTGFVKPWILLSFVLLFIVDFQLNVFFSICYSLYFFLFIVPSLMRIIQQTPTKAFEKGRKITMFEEGPALVLPKPMIEHLYFNSNIFRFALTVFDFNTYTLFFFLIINTLLGFDFFICLLLLQSVLLFLIFYSAAMITHTLKTSDVLDLRGIFLAVHQYYWCTKYTHNTLVFFFFIFLVYVLCFVWHFLLINVFLFILCIFIFFVFIVSFERLLSTWGNIVTYFQFADYYTWDDEFWSYLSPFLRDYVFWKPITPDDYEEPAPYYFEVGRKISGRHIILFYSVLAVTITFYFVGLFDGFNFVYFFIYFKFLLLFFNWYLYERLLTWWVSDPTLALMEFTYFELASYVTFGVVLLLLLLKL